MPQGNIDYGSTVPQKKEASFSARLAGNHQEVAECLRLRFNVFAGEMGARLSNDGNGLDKDRFDPFCRHLMVFDNRSKRVIATTRLLLDLDARRAGSYYSESEFDIKNILSQPGRFMEVGRTCIHPYYRRGSVLAILWQGIAQVIVKNKIDYLFGCGNIPLRNGDSYVNSVIHVLTQKHLSPQTLRVRPRIPLPKNNVPITEDVVLPTLLKGYLRQGAKICGDPYWDAEFQVANVFILLECDKISARYKKHYINNSR
jgi:putative hemolysin